VASTVASSEVSGFILCAVNKKEMQKKFLSLCNVKKKKKYVCCPASNK
jgi:hypothetical protein